MSASTLLIAANWLIFIYAVEQKEVLQSSLGYFLNPLVNVLLGVLFLRERLNTIQSLSVILAAVAVITLAFHVGKLPWIALLLAISFGTYGLLRKIARIDALIGLTVETLLLAPAALAYLLFLHVQGESLFLAGFFKLDLLLPLSGVVTAVPLLLFVGAAKRLRLATVGFLQYITPSLHFLWAITIFHEPFSPFHLLCFMLIWLGLALYSGDALWQSSPFRKQDP